MKYAASRVFIDNKEYHNYVVEVVDDSLLDFYPLTTEIPSTQWVREIVVLSNKIERITNI